MTDSLLNDCFNQHLPLGSIAMGRMLVWLCFSMQILAGGFKPNFPFPWGAGPLSITVLLDDMQVFLPFVPTDLSGCMVETTMLWPQ